jgi:hypothetical protein
MRTAWIALALIVACGACGQSQPPAPAPTKESGPPQKANQNKGQTANNDQRGAEERPFVVKVSGIPIVEVHSGPEAKQKAAETTDKQNNSPTLYWGLSADAWTAAFTFGLFVVGLATAIVFIFQSILLRRQVGEMVKATAATEKSAKAAEDTARETAFQAKDLWEARILQHRPKLHVRNIVLKGPLFQRGSPIRGQFYVSNIGGVRAHVEESHCEVLWNVNGLPMERPYEGKDGNHPMPDRPTIAAGSNATGIFMSEATFQFDIAPGGNDPLTHKLYVLGWIEYSDDLAIRRRTEFCREFLQRDGSARFYPVNDPDYEYEE